VATGLFGVLGEPIFQHGACDLPAHAIRIRPVESCTATGPVGLACRLSCANRHFSGGP
jgi:hypothetical protein